MTLKLILSNLAYFYVIFFLNNILLSSSRYLKSMNDERNAYLDSVYCMNYFFWNIDFKDFYFICWRASKKQCWKNVKQKILKHQPFFIIIDITSWSIDFTTKTNFLIFNLSHSEYEFFLVIKMESELQ